MVSKHPIEDLKKLPKEQKQALALMLKVLPQTPQSFQSDDLKDNVLHLLRRVMKRLSE
jgi:membrane carboxypeptidase/penicillin-binding protein PbpC